MVVDEEEGVQAMETVQKGKGNRAISNQIANPTAGRADLIASCWTLAR